MGTRRFAGEIMSACESEIMSILEPRYTPNDNPKIVYRHISLNGKHYRIQKCVNGKKEHYGTYQNIVAAVHERDQLESVEWDYDLVCELPLTPPGFSISDLPPFPRVRDRRPAHVPTIRQRSKYFGFRGIKLAKKLVKEDKLNKCWYVGIMYNNHYNHLFGVQDPLTADLIYNLVKEEVQLVKQ